MSLVPEMISLAWRLYCAKVANKLLVPENEKMMQLQLAQIFQTLTPLFECSATESYKVLLEVPVKVKGKTKIIDIVLDHMVGNSVTKTAIELKCFRLFSRTGDGKRGAQNIGMYDYWEDIENIEAYSSLSEFEGAYQFTLTDDDYYVEKPHAGPQVATFSTYKNRQKVTGTLAHKIANRKGEIFLYGSYLMDGWKKDGDFYFIRQQVNRRVF